MDEPRLKSDFSNIKKILYLSVVDAEDESFLGIREAISEQIQCLDSYEMEFPKSWYDLMVELQEEKAPYIRKETYYHKCYKKGIEFKEDEDSDENNIYDWLLDWFNDLGVCFSYHRRTNSKKLDSYALLNPQWLTRAAYFLITEGTEWADNGILKKEDIEVTSTSLIL